MGALFVLSMVLTAILLCSIESRGHTGHADDKVIQGRQNQLTKATSFGAPSALENTLAKMIIERVPSVEIVWFTNSGMEACMSALRLASILSM